MSDSKRNANLFKFTTKPISGADAELNRFANIFLRKCDEIQHNPAEEIRQLVFDIAAPSCAEKNRENNINLLLANEELPTLCKQLELDVNDLRNIMQRSLNDEAIDNQLKIFMNMIKDSINQSKKMLYGLVIAAYTAKDDKKVENIKSLRRFLPQENTELRELLDSYIQKMAKRPADKKLNLLRPPGK